MSLATVVLAQATRIELPFPPVVFGLIAIIIFTLLGFVTFSYRHVANRHNQVSGRQGGDGHGDGGAHGA
jgi:hypothetical protein